MFIVENKIEHMLTDPLSIDTNNTCARTHTRVSFIVYVCVCALPQQFILSVCLIYIKLWTCQSQQNENK